MRVMGIDPGTITLGYGIIDSNDSLLFINCGTLRVNKRSPMGERLSFLYGGLTELIQRFHPDVVAVEQPFVARNVKSAFTLGRAQAVAMLAAANKGIPVFEYSPAQVKQRVTNYGASAKDQIQEMVRLILNLEDVPEPDAADALAIAICHTQETRLQTLLAGNEGKG